MNDAFHDMLLKWAGFLELRKGLGLFGALRFGFGSELLPDPFSKLGPPENEDERLSRDQIRSAVNLYSLLRERLGREKALEIMEPVILAATLVHLRRTIGALDVPAYLNADESGRRRIVEALTSCFFNATSVLDAVEETSFVHRVTHCRFVPLCRETGVPELTPLFCKGDLAFFASGPVELQRPGTLAEGASECRFEFSLRETSNPHNS